MTDPPRLLELEWAGAVRPAEILAAMQREAAARQAVLGGGRLLVPNHYMIGLSAYDHGRLAPHAAALAQQLAAAQAAAIAEQAWTVYGDVLVEIDLGEGLEAGMFRVVAELRPDGHPARSPATSGATLVADDGREFPLPPGPVVLGRDGRADLRLRDPRVSRRHVRLEVTGGRVLLTDLSSANGTLVNGARVDVATLTDGDMVQVGTTLLMLRYPSA